MKKFTAMAFAIVVYCSAAKSSYDGEIPTGYRIENLTQYVNGWQGYLYRPADSLGVKGDLIYLGQHRGPWNVGVEWKGFVPGSGWHSYMVESDLIGGGGIRGEEILVPLDESIVLFPPFMPFPFFPEFVTGRLFIEEASQTGYFLSEFPVLPLPPPPAPNII